MPEAAEVTAEATNGTDDLDADSADVDPETHEILGCHLIGPEASTMLHQVLAVMRLDNDVRHLKDMVTIHPALPEALLAAGVEAVKKIRRHAKEGGA